MERTVGLGLASLVGSAVMGRPGASNRGEYAHLGMPVTTIGHVPIARAARASERGKDLRT